MKDRICFIIGFLPAFTLLTYFLLPTGIVTSLIISSSIGISLGIIAIYVNHVLKSCSIETGDKNGSSGMSRPQKMDGGDKFVRYKLRRGDISTGLILGIMFAIYKNNVAYILVSPIIWWIMSYFSLRKRKTA